MRFSLRFSILAVTVIAGFLGLSRVLDAYGVAMLVWLLTPIWAAFGYLYFRMSGRRRRR